MSWRLITTPILIVLLPGLLRVRTDVEIPGVK